MIHNVTFKDDPYGNVEIRIDDESLLVDIYEIDRKQTYFVIDSLDTPLYDDIYLNAQLLCENEPVDDGIVSVSIWNTRKTREFYHNSFVIDKGHIQELIPNKLKSGEYIFVMEYAGNKYYQPTSINQYFKIRKRYITFDFSKERYYGNPQTAVTISGTLKDIETQNPISFCTIYYHYEDTVEEVTSDIDGKISFNVIVPSPDISHCGTQSNTINYSDDRYLGYGSNTNTYDPPQYPLYVTLETNSYILNETYTYVIANKIPTIMSADIIEDTLTIMGHILTEDTYDTGYAKYGKVTIEAMDGYYKDSSTVDQYGNFSKNIIISNLAQCITNDNDSNEPHNNEILKIITQLNIQAIDNHINVGEDMFVHVEVTSTRTVTDGMVSFFLYNEQGKNIYRYVTQISNSGEVDFVFFTSKKGRYTVKAEYYGIGRFKDSTSEEDIIIEVV